jgi:Tfp pilus assembly protein PilW
MTFICITAWTLALAVAAFELVVVRRRWVNPDRLRMTIERRQMLHRHDAAGFSLVEVLVSMALSMTIIGALATVMLANARLAATLATVAQAEGQARARLSSQLVDLDTPVAGVTIALDPSTPEDAACRLFRLTTATPQGRTYEAYASRGCANQ